MCEILPFWKNEDTKELVTAEYGAAVVFRGVMTRWEPGAGTRDQGTGARRERDGRPHPRGHWPP